MGIGTAIVIGVSVALAAAAAAYSIISARGAADQDNLDPQKLDQLNVTQAKEGSVVPIIYGRVKMAGNIIWHGNYVTEEITQKTGTGGKGGGGGSSTSVTGYNYYADVWQSLCMGKAIITDTYVNEVEQSVEAAASLYNDGTEEDYPDIDDFANKISGVAHIYYDRLFLGENTNNIPTIHFVVERVLETPVDSQNLDTGSNPAAIIYDLLIQGGVDPIEIDIATFNTAAAYWAGKNYGLNINFNSQQDISAMINRVLSFVDGSVYEDEFGKFAIKAFDPADSAIDTISDDDLFEFSMRRPAYSQLPNDFHGTYIDDNHDYSQRIVTTMNQGSIELQDFSRNKRSIDLTGFRRLEQASDRLFEIMKVETYPTAEATIKTHMGYSTLVPGDIITVNNSDFGISNADFRVIHIDNSSIDKNEVALKLRQVSETLFDDNFIIAGGTKTAPIGTNLNDFSRVKIFEMPWTNTYGSDPAFLFLIARETGNETGFQVLSSLESGANYNKAGSFTTFSQAGNLVDGYPDTTRTIDNTLGILYTPFSFDPGFEPISRQELFTHRRFAIIGNEMIAFEDIQPEGLTDYRLTGCIRGCLNTPVEDHSAGAEIFLVEISNNVLTGVEAVTLYFKFLPVFSSYVLDASLATEHMHDLESKARIPRDPGRLLVERVGNNIALTIYPNTPGVNGTGDGIPANVTDVVPHPFSFLGDFKIDYLGITEYIGTTEHEFTIAGAVDITVASRINGFVSPGLAIHVGTTNGTYKS